MPQLWMIHQPTDQKPEAQNLDCELGSRRIDPMRRNSNVRGQLVIIREQLPKFTFGTFFKYYINF